MIEIPWLVQDNDLPFSDISELPDQDLSWEFETAGADYL